MNLKNTLIFEIYVSGDRTAALDKRDDIIDILRSFAPLDLVLTDDGMRIVMAERRVLIDKTTEPTNK